MRAEIKELHQRLRTTTVSCITTILSAMVMASI
jgi:ABC-type sugar transport system ATPase subunit